MESEQEEDEDLNRQKSEISAEEWGGIFERLNSVNNESDELIIDQVCSYLFATCLIHPLFLPHPVSHKSRIICLFQVVHQIISLNNSTLSYWWRGGMELKR